MQTRTVHQYQTFGPGLDNLVRDIEFVLQVYAEIAIIFAILILGVILCLLICEMREPKESKAVSRRSAFAARELSDTRF